MVGMRLVFGAGFQNSMSSPCGVAVMALFSPSDSSPVGALPPLFSGITLDMVKPLGKSSLYAAMAEDHLNRSSWRCLVKPSRSPVEADEDPWLNLSSTSAQIELRRLSCSFCLRSLLQKATVQVPSSSRLELSRRSDVHRRCWWCYFEKDLAVIFIFIEVLSSILNGLNVFPTFSDGHCVKEAAVLFVDPV